MVAGIAVRWWANGCLPAFGRSLRMFEDVIESPERPAMVVGGNLHGKSLFDSDGGVMVIMPMLEAVDALRSPRRKGPSSRSECTQ